MVDTIAYMVEADWFGDRKWTVEKTTASKPAAQSYANTLLRESTAKRIRVLEYRIIWSGEGT